MKHLAFLLCCLTLASCATKFHSGMLEATDPSPVATLPPVHTDLTPAVKVTHDALVINGKQANRTQEKVEILVKNEVESLVMPGEAYGSITPTVDLDFQYKGYGWTVLSAMTFMSINLLGVPAISWEVDAHLNYTVRDGTGKIVWEKDYFQTRKHNMGIYYNHTSAEHVQGTSVDLVRDLLTQARADLYADGTTLAAALQRPKADLTAIREPELIPASITHAPVGELLFNQNPDARDVRVIAVIPKTGTDCAGNVRTAEDLAAYSETALLGTYNVVDRQFIEDTLNEIKLGMTGITFEDNVLQAGCIANAEGYLFVEHGCLQDREAIKAKLVHCESSQIVWNCISKGSSPQETFESVAVELAP